MMTPDKEVGEGEFGDPGRVFLKKRQQLPSVMDGKGDDCYHW